MSAVSGQRGPPGWVRIGPIKPTDINRRRGKCAWGERRMRITQRQMEFLQQVKNIADGTNAAVHYTAVAEELGVSKWTAYEMLRTLERHGLLTSCYEVNHTEQSPGRAMVLFSLSERAAEALSATSKDQSVSPREWSVVKHRLLTLSGHLGVTDPTRLVEQLLAELPMLERPVVFGAYVLTMLATQLLSIGERSSDLLGDISRHAVKAETTLALFVGTVAGTMQKAAPGSPLITQVSKHLSRFVTNLPKLSEPEQTLLRELLNEVLEGVGLTQARPVGNTPSNVPGPA